MQRSDGLALQISPGLHGCSQAIPAAGVARTLQLVGGMRLMGSAIVRLIGGGRWTPPMP